MERFSAIPSGPTGGDEGPIVGALSTISPIKGQDVLLRAFAKVKAKVPKARLVLAGKVHDPDYHRRLLRLIGRLGLGGAVDFPGFADPAGMLAKLDVFVLPSRTEGSPRALLEAMAAGRPIVATKVGGVPEIVEDGSSGLLVEPDDPEGMASAILRLLESPRLARLLGEGARRRAEERFSLEAHVEGVLRVLRRLPHRDRPG